MKISEIGALNCICFFVEKICPELSLLSVITYMFACHLGVVCRSNRYGIDLWLLILWFPCSEIGPVNGKLQKYNYVTVSGCIKTVECDTTTVKKG